MTRHRGFMRLLFGMDRVKSLLALMAAHLYAPKKRAIHSINHRFKSGILDLIFSSTWYFAQSNPHIVLKFQDFSYASSSTLHPCQGWHHKVGRQTFELPLLRGLRACLNSINIFKINICLNKKSNQIIFEHIHSLNESSNCTSHDQGSLFFRNYK